MISYLRGKVIYKGRVFVIVDVGGIGYKVFVSEKAISKMPQIGQEVKLHAFLHVREDALELYGFLAPEELEIFEIAYGISGVGPKAALGISGLGSMDNLREAVSKGNTSFFERVPGVGRKKAQKIALELTGRLNNVLGSKKNRENQKTAADQETFKALMNLGFPKKSCLEILEIIERENPDLPPKDKIKLALKYLARR